MESPQTTDGARPAAGAASAPLLVALALGAAGATAAFVIAAALAMAVIEPVGLPAEIGGEQNQTAESGLYLLAFAVILPLAALFGPRLADRIAAGPNRALLEPLAAILTAGLLAALGAARLCAEAEWGEGIGVAALFALAWSVAAAGLLARSAAGAPWVRAMQLARRPRAGAAVWIAAGALALGLVLGFTALESISVPVLVAGLVIAVAVALSDRVRAPAISKRAGRAADVAVLVLLVLAIPDFIVFPEEAGSPLPFSSEIMRFHQNFLLGPANEVLGGGAVLVDTASQYGVSSVYLTAGWSEVFGPGYGTFALLDAALTVLFFAAGYAVLRMAGVSRLIAAAALALAVAALAYNLIYPVGGLPQQGPLRYGMPMIVVFAATAGAWRPAWERGAWIGQAAAVGLSSVWGFESFAFTLATVAALSAFSAHLAPRGERRRLLARRAAGIAAACVVAHLALVALTLILRGELPDWGQYLAYLDAFLFGRLGDLTYDIDPWRAGLAVGFGYFLAGLALLLAIRRRRDLVEARRPRFVALVGVTAYGIVLLSYFVDRSTLLVLPYVCLPLLLAGALWLDLLRREDGVGPAARRAATVVALSLAAVVAAAAAPSFPERLKTSALGHLVPGGREPGDSLDRLLDLPPLDRRAPAAQRLLEETQPGSGRVAMIVSPDLATEVMLQEERATALALVYPWGDSFIAAERIPGIHDAVAELRTGDRLLLDQPALDAFDTLQAEPGRDPIAEPTTLGPLAPVQEVALQEIGRRFDLRVVGRDGGFIAAELVPTS